MNMPDFWNELKDKYPAEMTIFGDWVDRYKEKVHWKYLFRSDTGIKLELPKFHQLPSAMQLGIFIQFTVEARPIMLIPFPTSEEQIHATMEEWIQDVRQWFYNSHEAREYIIGRKWEEEKAVIMPFTPPLPSDFFTNPDSSPEKDSYDPQQG